VRDFREVYRQAERERQWQTAVEVLWFIAALLMGAGICRLIWG